MKDEEEQQSKQLISILDLPEQIMIDILSRAQFKTIITCKCVCKSWFNLISDPYFADTHFKVSNTCILTHPSRDPITKNPFVLHWEFLNGLERHDRFKFIDSFDGLVCISILTTGTYCICNPISGEYVMIPPSPAMEPGFHTFRTCFGLSPKTNRYKILQISYLPNLMKWTIDIITIGTDKYWRKAVSLSMSFPFIFPSAKSHWVQYIYCSPKFIHCFDFDNEDFEKVFLPEFGADHRDRSTSMSLGLVDSCLCLYHLFEGSLQIWVMKEFGVQESWTKKLSIPYTSSKRLHLKWLVYNREYLFFDSLDGDFMSYNLRNKRVTTDKQSGKWTQNKIPYKPSFILLEEIARRQNWKLVDIHRGIYGDQRPY